MQRGIPVLVDGAQGAVHLDVDVRDLDVDFYAITGHKLYGPTGVGALYGKKEWLAKLPPFLGGGEMINEVTKDRVTYNEPPHRFEAGTPPIVQAIGLGAALDYMRGVGRARFMRMRRRSAPMRTSGSRGSIRCASSAAPEARRRSSSFDMKNAHPHDIATIIDRTRRRGARRHALRAAPAGALRRDLDLPRLFRDVQYVRGSR